MDYDDNQYPPYQNEERKNWLIPMLLGIIIGVLIVTVAIPAVIEDNNDTVQKEVPDYNKQPEGSETVNYVNVDVTTQITEVVEKVTPAVVGVTNIQLQADFWRQQENSEAGTGSGVIYKIEDGYAYVVTNHHVIERADTVEVVLDDETG